MSVEEQLADQDEVEKDAERLVELEEDVREAYIDAKTTDSEPDTHIDLKPTTHIDTLLRPGIRKAHVISAERKGSKVKLKLDDGDGGTTTSRIPYPDDPTDGTEPLVRLCNWDGTPVDRVADIDHVPAVDTEYGTKVFVPRGTRQHNVAVTLPGDKTVSFSYTSLSSRIERFAENFSRLMLETPLASGNLKYYDAHPEVFATATIAVPILLIVASIAVGAAVNSAIIALIGSILSCLLGCLIFASGLMLGGSNTFEMH